MEMFEGMINDYDNTNVLTYKLGKTNVWNKIWTAVYENHFWQADNTINIGAVSSE